VTDYDLALARVRAASQEISDSPWHEEDQTPGRDIAPDPAGGRVLVFSDSKRGPVVSIELDGLSPDQAVAVLRALTPGYHVTNTSMRFGNVR
jgi:hypothetical protein